MPIIKKDEVAPERPVVIVIYGTPGSGKTSLATTADAPILIDCDRGFDRAVQRVDTLCANTWEDVLAAIPSFAAYHTIICDTAKAMLDDFLSEYVCKQNYKLRTNSLKRFGQMGDEFKTFVGTLQSNGTDLIFVCHDKETSEGDVVRHSPDCTGQSKDILLRKADQVGYISIVNGKRHITFDPSDNFVGKNVAQIKSMPVPDASSPEFSAFMANIVKQVKTSIQSHSEAQRKANVLITKLRDDLAKVDDNDSAAALISACKELPDIMKRPFFAEISAALTGRGFAYADGKFTLPEQKEDKKKKNKGKDENANDNADNAKQ